MLNRRRPTTLVKVLALSLALAAGTAACSSGGGDSSKEAREARAPQLPHDFTWTGRYVVPDLDVEVPFTWNGRDGNFQMIAGGDGLPIHFTNLIYDGQLYTLTYEWPGVPRRPCSYVGPFTVDALNAGLAEASFVGRETLHDEQERDVFHFRSTSVLEVPPELLPQGDGALQLRVPLMAGDIYVDVDDPTVFWRVLHFGVQNLYDPNLDEWILIDQAEPVAGQVTLPEECAAALAAAADT